MKRGLGSVMVCGLFSFACKTAEPAQLAVAEEMDRSQVPALSCPSHHEVVSFVLRSTEVTPPIDVFVLPRPENAELPPRVVMANDDTASLRLDACLDQDGSFKLQRAALLKVTGNLDVVEMVPEAKVKGLDAAFMERDYREFELLIPFKTYRRSWEDSPSASDEALLVKGGTFEDRDYVAVAVVRIKDGGLVLSDGFMRQVVVGRLEYGDFAHNPCLGAPPAKGTLQLGSATFAWDGCQVSGTSGGATPVILEVSITDNAPQLPADARGRVYTHKVEGPEDRRFIYGSGHHRVCEHFVLKLDHAQYAASSTAEVTGSEVCPPLPDEVPPPPLVGVLYRMKYGQGPWSDSFEVLGFKQVFVPSREDGGISPLSKQGAAKTAIKDEFRALVLPGLDPQACAEDVAAAGATIRHVDLRKSLIVLTAPLRIAVWLPKMVDCISTLRPEA